VRETTISDSDLSTLLLIRHFELALLDLFSRGELNGTTHTCLGQEHVAVALGPLLRDDFVFSNHRGHGHYLALFDDPVGLLAEIMGREGAVCRGVGGSQHIRRDRYLSTGVQGQSLCVAAGVALHLRDTRQGRIAVAFIGDGTWGEGAVYEGLNLAALWRVPLLTVVEHNGIAQSTATARQMAGTVADRAAAFGIGHRLVSSTDVNEVRTAAAALVDQVRVAGAPMVLEVATQRLGPHSKGDDTRPHEVIELARADDWYAQYQSAIPEQFHRLDDALRHRVAAVVREVQNRPPSTWDG